MICQTDILNPTYYLFITLYQKLLGKDGYCMIRNYTRDMEEKITQYKDINPMDFEEIDAFCEFIIEEEISWPFHKALTRLLEISDYSGDLTNDEEKTDYLFKKMKELPCNISKTTIKAWITGTQRPKVEPNSRERMYQICFALQLSYENVKWFFRHVYLDRCFNCHTIKEAIYSYCFQHNLTYATALQLIQTVSEAPEQTTPIEKVPNYTKFVQEQISSFQSEKELLYFLITNKHNFHAWNQTALSYIDAFIEEIRGSKENKDAIESLQKTRKNLIRNKQTKNEYNSKTAIQHLHNIKAEEYQSFGLLLREIYEDAHKSTANETIGENMLEILKSKNILSIDFILQYLLGTSTGIQKKKNIPNSIRVNFPSKKTFSDILDTEKVKTSESYDAIRKALILLKFYTFWCRVKLQDSRYKGYSPEQLSNSYQEETSFLLFQCGYEDLYAGNPYDGIFLVFSKNKISPLDFCREFISNILSKDDND